MRKKGLYITYVLGMLLGAFLLFLTMFVRNQDIITELNSEIVSEDKSIAENLDEYLSKNFGFRGELLSLYTKMQDLFFSTSSIDKVILGTKGYLFYEETVDDYCKTNILSNREIYNINKTLELMQEYASNEGARMLFLVAPNKNSLYDYMPYYYIKGEQASNWELLEQELTVVDYVDAFAIFENRSEELYYKTDSHWNDYGAYYVYEETMEMLGRTYEDRLADGYTEVCNMIGDLQRMLYPIASENEKRIVFHDKSEYVYLTNTRSVEQSYIESYNAKGEGSLLMFRDSFANNLIDYYSEEFEYAIYDKSIPYDMMKMQKYEADTVILEIAERNLENLQTCMPQLEAPLRNIEVDPKSECVVESIEFLEEDDWVKIVGTIKPEYVVEDSCFYVKMNHQIYELTPQKIEENEYGFIGYLHNEMKDGSVEILVLANDTAYGEIINVPEEIEVKVNVKSEINSQEKQELSNKEKPESENVKDDIKEELQIEKNEQIEEDEHVSPEISEEKYNVENLIVAAEANQILVIEGEGVHATVVLYTKTKGGAWSEELSSRAYIGRNGLGKTKEGDGKTPIGIFSITEAFGILENPGCLLEYCQVDDTYYWVDDSDSIYYNQFVSANEVEKDWSSAEHISKMAPAYNYVLALNYNSESTPGKGSAIFIHCEIGKATSGCISIPQKDMMFLMQEIIPDCVVIIDYEGKIQNY